MRQGGGGNLTDCSRVGGWAPTPHAGPQDVALLREKFAVKAAKKKDPGPVAKPRPILLEQGRKQKFGIGQGGAGRARCLCSPPLPPNLFYHNCC